MANLFRHFNLFAPKRLLKFLVFKSFNYEHSWWKLFQKWSCAQKYISMFLLQHFFFMWQKWPKRCLLQNNTGGTSIELTIYRRTYSLALFLWEFMLSEFFFLIMFYCLFCWLVFVFIWITLLENLFCIHLIQNKQVTSIQQHITMVTQPF